jgi:hypothetical protein
MNAFDSWRTYSREVEKRRKRILIWQSYIRLTENIKESIRASFEGPKTTVIASLKSSTYVILAAGRYSSKFEQRAIASVEVLGRNTKKECKILAVKNWRFTFTPWVRFYHWKFELSIVWIHVFNLLARGRSEDLDYLDELVDAGIAGKYRLAEKELGEDASGRPDIDLASVICCAKD